MAVTREKNQSAFASVDTRCDSARRLSCELFSDASNFSTRELVEAELSSREYNLKFTYTYVLS